MDPKQKNLVALALQKAETIRLQCAKQDLQSMPSTSSSSVDQNDTLNLNSCLIDGEDVMQYEEVVIATGNYIS